MGESTLAERQDQPVAAQDAVLDVDVVTLRPKRDQAALLAAAGGTARQPRK